MKYETIEIKREKDIVTVLLNRPEVHNAMNEKLMTELTSCFKELSNDDNTRIISLQAMASPSQQVPISIG